MAQTHEGAMKVQASRFGMNLEEYLCRINSGLNWCWKCKNWKQRDEFYPDKTRHDGMARKCISCTNVKVKIPRTPKEDPHVAQRAHDAIRYAVRRGIIRPARELMCACGNKASHYHHHNGYVGHELDVIPLCMSCHFRRHYVYSK
jgi:hypothetical protein